MVLDVNKSFNTLKAVRVLLGISVPAVLPGESAFATKTAVLPVRCDEMDI